MSNKYYAVITPQPFFDMETGEEKGIIYNPVGGTIPNKRVVSHMIARWNNFVVGNTYQVEIEEKDPSEQYGRNFFFINKGNYNGSLLDAVAVYGEAKVVDVKGTEPFSFIGMFEEDTN